VLRDDRQGLHASGGRELLAQRLRQICHLGEVAGATLVDPAEQLRGAEFLLAEFFAERSQPLEIEIEQIGRGHGIGARSGFQRA